MKTLEQQLSTYASYHRSRRNVMTHFIGIPLIVYAIICLLARIDLQLIEVFSSPLTAAHLVALIVTVYYLMLSMSLGVMMAIVFTGLTYLALPVAIMPTSYWLSISIGLFFIGWLFQFVGHYFEGQKPAFLDDVIGLIIGPLFVLVEVLFLLGLYQSLANKIIANVGPAKP